MSNLPFDPLLVSIAAPLVLALAIAGGLPKRWAVRLAYVAFAIPVLMALHVWFYFGEAAKESHGYAYLTHYSTGLDAYGIGLTLGLNGIALPLFVLALALTWLYDRTDGLLAPVMAHGLFNAANVVLLLANK